MSPTSLALAAVLLVHAPAVDRSWRDDPAWYDGTAEWALYESSREIYGRPRVSETTIFTNKQLMDPATTTKVDGDTPNAIEVFKHNVSELFPTESYTYRFLTTSFVRTDTLEPFKVVASTQEDCGATYKQFVVADGQVEAKSFCYFPAAGPEETRFPVPRAPETLAFHDALTLTLRDYPFEQDARPEGRIMLVADQTNPRATPQRPQEATVRYVGRETIQVPYGALEAYHLRVEHEPMGGTTSSEYWFAADPDLRHVLVRYEGPYGVTYRLKRLDWWAYWREPRPE